MQWERWNILYNVIKKKTNMDTRHVVTVHAIALTQAYNNNVLQQQYVHIWSCQKNHKTLTHHTIPNFQQIG